MDGVGDLLYLPNDGWCVLANVFPTTILLYRIDDHVEIIANRKHLKHAYFKERTPQKVRCNRFNTTMGDTVFYATGGEYPSISKGVIRSAIYIDGNREKVNLVDSRRPLEETSVNMGLVWKYAL